MKPRNLKTAIFSSLLVAALPALVLADRGGGSIRAAGRQAPPPQREPAQAPAPPARGEPPRAEPPRAEPPRGEPPQQEDRSHGPPPEVHTPPAPQRDDNRRDWDDHDEDVRNFGGFGHGEPVRIIRGQHVHVLPQAYVSVAFGNVNYFYDGDGAYYQQQGDGDYLVVQPPVGAIVPYLPSGIATIVAGPTTYYYLDGVFYVQQGDSYAVVNPPPGIVVPAVPSDANQVVINGTVIYQYSGFNYTPSIQDGVTVYMVTPM